MTGKYYFDIRTRLSMPNTPKVKTINNLESEIVIRHSQKGAVIFGALVVGMIMAIIGMFWFLSRETSDTVPLFLTVAFVLIGIVVLHVSKGLFADAGKIALTIGREGVKFDRYQLIAWKDIEDVYVREESEGNDTLWLSVKEGVTFLQNGSSPLMWLAKKSGLHRHIDITGYGWLSMNDEDIHELLKQGLKQFRVS